MNQGQKRGLGMVLPGGRNSEGKLPHSCVHRTWASDVECSVETQVR